MPGQNGDRFSALLPATSLFALVLSCALAAPAQTTLKGGVTYTDRSSETCEERNQNNPFAGMNPLVCHGESAPTDSRGQCSLNIGTVWKKVGNTCYYCAPINPPIQGIIIPLDQLTEAGSQGWRCGGDQADECMAVCSGESTYTPPPGTGVEGGGPGLPYTPPPKQEGPPSGYGPPPGPPPVPGAANPCLPYGRGGYDYCANPEGTRLPAGCVCNVTHALSGPPNSPPQNQAFNNQLLADAQTVLQSAGRISKAMTDAMDVTKHNNVGVGVAVGAYFGAAGKLFGVVAQQYKLLAAAGDAVAAAQKTPILQIANEAAAESTTIAGQAEQAAAQAANGGAGRTLGGSTAPGVMGAAGTDPGYLEGIVLKSGSSLPAQGVLPTCAVLSCARLSELLGRNIPLMRIIEKIKPRIILNADGSVSGGLTAPEIADALKSIGINAQTGTGMTNMMNQVRAGNPVIAGVYTNVESGTATLHAIVIEGVETQGGVAGLTIYDPAGWVYWQPIQTFQKYFTQQFVKAI